jgi:Flp pilus assembly protein TadG
VLGFVDKAKRWLLNQSDEPRRALRTAQPEIVVHYWDGAAPDGRQLRDISETGAYIYTAERWYIGTIVRIILQGTQTIQLADGMTAPKCSTCVRAVVVRHGTDGVGVEFIFGDAEEEKTLRAFLSSIPVQPGRLPALTGPSHRSGQALIEFSLIIPLVFLLAINAVNFGGFIFAWITVANAARSGAQYMIMSSASGTETPATTGQITGLITTDVGSLLRGSSVCVVSGNPSVAPCVVATCTNNTAAANGCTTLFDPEAPAYTLATVDVTYTYKPFIPLFPVLGIWATMSTTALHRKAVMRMLQ